MIYIRNGEIIMNNKQAYFKQANDFNRRLFASKDKMRMIWAKQPMEVKIEQLIKLQEITAVMHPELRNIIPWKLTRRMQ